MNQVLTFVIVTGVWIAISGALGIYLSRKGRPYKAVSLVIHGIISLFIFGGIISCIFGLQAIADNKLFSTIAIYLLGLAALIKIVSGLAIAFSKADKPAMRWFHKIGSYSIVISLAASIVFLMVKI